MDRCGRQRVWSSRRDSSAMRTVMRHGCGSRLGLGCSRWDLWSRRGERSSISGLNRVVAMEDRVRRV